MNEAALLLGIKSHEDAKRVGKLLGMSWRTAYERRKELIENLQAKAFEEAGIINKENDDFLTTAVEVERTVQGLLSNTINEKDFIDFRPKEKTGWIAIVFSGDWHLEGVKTDIQSLYNMMDTIAKTPRLYLTFMGDGGDYFCGGLANGQFETVFAPQITRKIFWKFIEKAQNKIVAMIKGDHEVFAENAADYDFISDIAKRLSLQYLGLGGDINLKANGFEYKIHARHRYRFNSSVDMFRTCTQYLMNEDSTLDVIAIAHNHVNGLAMIEFQKRKRILLRTGVFKITDRYSEKFAFIAKKFTSDIPAVLFNLDTKETRIASSIEETGALLNFLNKETA